MRRHRYHVGYYKANKTSIISRIKAYRDTERGQQVMRSAKENERASYPIKATARQAVKIAKRKGTISEQPCEECGTKSAEAHHPDYTKPLEVKWLCPQCHRAEHERIKTEETP